MNPERGPEIIKKRTEKDISKLAEGYFGNEKEVKDFVDFVTKKIEKMSRRDFLKIAGGTAIGLSVGVGYKYFEKNIDKLWAEYQEKRQLGYEVVYSKEMTELYEKVKDLPEKEINQEDVSKNLKGVENELKYIEFIKNSEKKNIDSLIDNLIKTNSDTIIFGETHGHKSNAENAVKILEEFKNKSPKKIIKIGLEFLDFKDQKQVEYTKKFNKKEVSPEEFYSKGFGSDIRPLLGFAQKNNIPIEGLEDKENFGDSKGLERFTSMSHRVGEITKEKNEDEIVVIFAGSSHATKESWSFPELADYLDIWKPVQVIPEEAAKIADEKDYTFKEYLEKQSLKPAVVNLKDLGDYSKGLDRIFGYTYNFLEEEKAVRLSKHFKERWNNYKIDKKEPFWTKEGDEIYTFVNPSEIPKTPPALNMFETIRKNHPILYKMIKNEDVDYRYEVLVSQSGRTHEKAKIADLDLKTGEVKKLYLPEQAKNQ